MTYSNTTWLAIGSGVVLISILLAIMFRRPQQYVASGSAKFPVVRPTHVTAPTYPVKPVTQSMPSMKQNISHRENYMVPPYPYVQDNKAIRAANLTGAGMNTPVSNQFLGMSPGQPTYGPSFPGSYDTAKMVTSEKDPEEKDVWQTLM